MFDTIHYGHFNLGRHCICQYLYQNLYVQNTIVATILIVLSYMCIPCSIDIRAWLCLQCNIRMSYKITNINAITKQYNG